MYCYSPTEQVKDIMDESQLARIQQASTDLIAERIAATPDGVTRTADQEGKPLWDEATGEWKEMPIRQPGRYSFGSHGNLHRPEWCMLADLPRLSTILEAIFQSKDYMCWGAGGDFALPGTMEYQNLHSAPLASPPPPPPPPSCRAPLLVTWRSSLVQATLGPATSSIRPAASSCGTCPRWP